MATRETLIGFEAAVDFVRDRVGSMDLCDHDRTNVGGFLQKLTDEVTKRKVQQIELQFLDLWSGARRRSKSASAIEGGSENRELL